MPELNQMIAAVEWYNALSDPEKAVIEQYAAERGFSLAYAIQYQYDLILRNEKVYKPLK